MLLSITYSSLDKKEIPSIAINEDIEIPVENPTCE
jgi:hypothetical protein